MIAALQGRSDAIGLISDTGGQIAVTHNSPLVQTM
jgi:hypothetical protein